MASFALQGAVTTRRPGSEDLPDLMTRSEVANYTGLSIPTLARWTQENVGPRSVVLGGRARRYRKVDVLSWLDALAEAS